MNGNEIEPKVSFTSGELWRRRMRRIRRRVRRMVPFASGLLASFAALLVYSLVVPSPHQLSAREVSDTVAQAMASATPPPAFSTRVYQTVQPSLVLIQTQMRGPKGELEHGLGSGVVIDDRGDILTARHVVADARKIELTFADGTQSSAQVMTAQPENDIAVLRASQPPAQIVPATLGSPGAMHIGDQAFAVGNPFGLYGSMSAGVISGFDRSFQPVSSNQRLKGLIQIDAAVNPGNSGGPLLNRDGQVVAIVVGIVNPTEQDVFIGIGFAVPITVAASGAGLPQY